MIKNWKSLFVKDENQPESNSTPKQTTSDLSFPVNKSGVASLNAYNTVSTELSAETKEVMEVYEKGLDSINMPGYDFYEFYKAIQTAGPHNQQAYNMAFQMAKAMDNTLTVQKLVNDADFYISKINEVHSQYVTQGQQKLNEISNQLQMEKTDLAKAIDQKVMRLAQLRSELTELENELQTKRNALAKVDDIYMPREQAIRSKLSANDLAKGNSASKLIAVKDNIQKLITS
jgi:DNA-binding transcriptional MerR regulator